MKLYTIFYKTDKQIINKTNMTQEEVQNFINSLEKDDNSELRIKQIKEKNDCEEER